MELLFDDSCMIKNLVIPLALLGIASFFMLDYIVPNADAHNVTSQILPSDVQIKNENFDKHMLSTGETLTIKGTLYNSGNEDLRGYLSIFSESSENNDPWEMLARDPASPVFVVYGNSAVDFSLSAKALNSGTYHIHTQFSINEIGSKLGSGQEIVVDGNPIAKPVPYTDLGYQIITFGVISIVIIVISYYLWKKIR